MALQIAMAAFFCKVSQPGYQFTYDKAIWLCVIANSATVANCKISMTVLDLMQQYSISAFLACGTVRVAMADASDIPKKIILPIHESDLDESEEESDMEYDPVVESDIDANDDGVHGDLAPGEYCERCGAVDQDLVLWGSDEEVICTDCHNCEECGVNATELIDWGNGMGYICVDCAEREGLVRNRDQGAIAASSESHATGNTSNPDDETTQLGVSAASQDGSPTLPIDHA